MALFDKFVSVQTNMILAERGSAKLARRRPDAGSPALRTMSFDFALGWAFAGKLRHLKFGVFQQNRLLAIANHWFTIHPTLKPQPSTPTKKAPPDGRAFLIFVRLKLSRGSLVSR